MVERYTEEIHAMERFRQPSSGGISQERAERVPERSGEAGWRIVDGATSR